MTAEIVVTEEDGVRIIRMNRPEKKNALTQTMYAEMTRALREAEANDTIRCVVLAGCPGAFCAGSDISDFQKRAEGGLKPVTVDFLHALARKLMRGNLDDILRRVDTEAMYFKERLQSDEARAAFAAFFTRKK